MKYMNEWTIMHYLWANKTSLTLPFFTEVPAPSQESEWSCICVLGVSILPLSTIFLLDFRTVLTVWYFLLFILFHIYPAFLEQ